MLRVLDVSYIEVGGCRSGRWSSTSRLLLWHSLTSEKLEIIQCPEVSCGVLSGKSKWRTYDNVPSPDAALVSTMRKTTGLEWLCLTEPLITQLGSHDCFSFCFLLGAPGKDPGVECLLPLSLGFLNGVKKRPRGVVFVKMWSDVCDEPGETQLFSVNDRDKTPPRCNRTHKRHWPCVVEWFWKYVLWGWLVSSFSLPPILLQLTVELTTVFCELTEKDRTPLTSDITTKIWVLCFRNETDGRSSTLVGCQWTVIFASCTTILIFWLDGDLNILKSVGIRGHTIKSQKLITSVCPRVHHTMRPNCFVCTCLTRRCSNHVSRGFRVPISFTYN